MSETQTWQDDDSQIPETLGRYEIIKRLAVGGMAELFLARVSGIQGFEKHVAIKRILPEHAQDSHFVDMFLDEARLAARLDHQNIVQVHDIGHEDGAYFFAMEYLHGEDLQEFLKKASHKGRFIPLEQALTIVSGVAAGLDYAHAKCSSDGRRLNIVHRDVAPSNIIVTYDGGVKLVDFGIARAKFRQSQTEVGRVKGKLSYMSPEQCRGEALDGRSDIFSLGIVMYELTTMSRLFRVEKGHKLQVMERIVRGRVPPPSTRVPDYPPELERIVMRALAGSRDERYQTGGDLLYDLEHFAKQGRLSLSSAALARCLRETVGYRSEPWLEDGAQAIDPGGPVGPGESGESSGLAERSDSQGVPSLASLVDRAAPPTALDSPPVGSLRAMSRMTTQERLATEGRMGPEAEMAARHRRKRTLQFAAVAAAVLVAVALVLVSQLGSETNGSAGAADSPEPDPVAAAGDDVAAEDTEGGVGDESEGSGGSEASADRADSEAGKRKHSRKSSRKRRTSSAGKSGDDRSTASSAKTNTGRRDRDSATKPGASARKANRTARSDAPDRDERAAAKSESSGAKAKAGDKVEAGDKDKAEDKGKAGGSSKDCNWDPNSPLPPSANRCRKD